MKTMNNVPEIELGIVAVSRDCFPIELSRKRTAGVSSLLHGKSVQLIKFSGKIL